jgi:hypothetical protein
MPDTADTNGEDADAAVRSDDEHASAEAEPKPIRVKATVVRTKKSSRWVREMAAHFWMSHGGPACEISEVARHFDIPRARVYAWAERDGWAEKHRAMAAETDLRLEAKSSFRVSEFVTVEQLDRALVSLFIGMTGVISDGGLQTKPRSNTDRPLVGFKVADYIVVADRLRDMLRREEDRGRLTGAASNLPIGIAKTDLRLLAELSPEKIRAVRLLAEGYMENLKRLSLVRPDAPPVSPDTYGLDNGVATPGAATVSELQVGDGETTPGPSLNGATHFESGDSEVTEASEDPRDRGE